MSHSVVMCKSFDWQYVISMSTSIPTTGKWLLRESTVGTSNSISSHDLVTWTSISDSDT